MSASLASWPAHADVLKLGISDEDRASLVAEAKEIKYKGRSCIDGKPLHVVVQRAEWNQLSTFNLVRGLLHGNADAEEKLTWDDERGSGAVFPLHLAVQSGRPEIIKALVQHRADVNVKSRQGDELHFTPLHEAAFVADVKMALMLIHLKADLNSQNLQKFTPLHVAVRGDAVDVGRILVRKQADLRKKDSVDRTPLEAAVAFGTFSKQLHVLGTWDLSDIRHVCVYQPGAGAAFIRKVALVKQGSGPGAFSSFKVNFWIKTLQQSPEAAVALLEVLTAVPREADAARHPLPAVALVDDLTVCYTGQKEWGFVAGVKPEWHKTLAPQYNKKQKDAAPDTRREEEWEEDTEASSFATLLPVPVQIRLLNLDGFVCPQVLRELALTKHWDVFEQPAVVALLKYVWINVVHKYHGLQMTYHCLELLVMILWTIYPPTDRGGTFWDTQARCAGSWSLLFVIGVRGLVQQLFECWYHFSRTSQRRESCWTTWRNRLWSYVWNLLTVSEWFGILLFIVFLGKTAVMSPTSFHFDLAQDVVLFSWVILIRWMSFVWSFRGYPFGIIGTKSLLLDGSFELRQDFFSVILGAVLIFFAFWHLFVNLDDGNTFGTGPVRLSGIMVATFRLLLQQDGSGIDGMLQLGRGGNPGPAGQIGDATTIPFMFLGQCMFSTTLMNALIAVYAGAFQSTGRRRKVYLRERAEICYRAMMQPKWPPNFSSRTPGREQAAGAASRAAGSMSVTTVQVVPASQAVEGDGAKTKASLPETPTAGPEGNGKALEPWLKSLRAVIDRYPRRIMLCVLVVTLLIWGGIIIAGTVHPIVPSILLLIATLLFDWVLLVRPWNDKEDRYLWWCAPANWFQDVESDFDNPVQGISEQFQEMESRLRSMEDRVAEDIKRLEEAIQRASAAEKREDTQTTSSTDHKKSSEKH